MHLRAAGGEIVGSKCAFGSFTAPHVMREGSEEAQSQSELRSSQGGRFSANGLKMAASGHRAGHLQPMCPPSNPWGAGGGELKKTPFFCKKKKKKKKKKS